MAGALTPENGWHLTPEGLQLCGGQLQKALNFDLREIGSGILSEEINRGTQESLSPGLVLQVSKIRNVSAPKINEESGGAPRMLKISLTDGKTTVHAVEMSKLDGISLNTAPGTKVKLIKEVPVSHGFLQLEAGSVKVLGGRVETLAAKWEIANEMATVSRNRRGPNAEGAEDGPPAWVPFGQKIGASGDKDFKAFSASQTAGATNNSNSKDTQASKDNATFDSQRQDAILQASKSGGQKVFGAGSKDIKEAENPKKRRGERGGGGGGGDRSDDKSTTAEASTTTPSTTSATTSTSEFAVNGGGRGENRRGGGRRGGRNQRDAEDKAAGQTKPSTNVSLFDFLEEKLPAEAANSDSGKKSALAAERGGSYGGSATDQRYGSGRRNQGGDDQPYDRPRDGGDRRRRGGGGGPVPDSRERENGSAGEGQGRTRGGGDKRGGSARNERGGGHEQRRGGGTSGEGRAERGADRTERGGDRGGRGGGRGGRRDGGRENREDFKTEEQPRRGADRDKPDRENGGRGRGGGRGGGGENGGRGGGRESQRNEPRGGDFTQGRQHESGGHARGGGKPHNNDRDFGEWSNSTYHNAQRTRGGGHQHQQQPPRREQQQQQQHSSSLINKMSDLHLDQSLHLPSRESHTSQQFVQVVKPLPQQQQHQDFSQPPPSGHQSSQWGSIGSSKGFNDQGGKQFWNQPAPPQQQQQQPLSNATSKIRWQKGDDALGLYWEDSLFYPVKITALTESTAVVLFKEYGNYEEVFLKDLLPLPSASGGSGSLHQQPRGPAGFIPSTPGLPPAFPH